MVFHSFFTVYVLKVTESISDIHTELPCLDDLENLGQLLVREVRNGDDCVSWIFTISSLFIFSRPGNPSLSYLFGDLENLGHLSVQEVLEVTQTCEESARDMISQKVMILLLLLFTNPLASRV